MEYPVIENNFVLVEIRLKDQSNWRKAMFYRNGCRPVFASYGSDVTDKVIEWRYEK